MFEKEAEEYKDTYFGFADERISEVQDFEGNYIDISERIMKTFIDGAEFGYNKANEWHFVKDGDLPKENKLYFVAIKDNGCAIAYFNGLHWETKYNLGDFGHLVETVIAWCEIPTFDKE